MIWAEESKRWTTHRHSTLEPLQEVNIEEEAFHSLMLVDWWLAAELKHGFILLHHIWLKWEPISIFFLQSQWNQLVQIKPWWFIPPLLLLGLGFVHGWCCCTIKVILTSVCTAALEWFATLHPGNVGFNLLNINFIGHVFTKYTAVPFKMIFCCDLKVQSCKC